VFLVALYHVKKVHIWLCGHRVDNGVLPFGVVIWQFPNPLLVFTITADCFRRGVLRVGVVKQPIDPVCVGSSNPQCFFNGGRTILVVRTASRWNLAGA
jgi:hypothetical protein